MGVLRRNFEKPLSYLKSALPSKLTYCKICAKNKTPLIWDQKYQICVLWSSNLNILLSYVKSAPSICLIAKFREIMKIPKFEIKNNLFRYFWARIFKKLLPWLRSAPLNLSNWKILFKKMSKFGTKNTLFGYFWARSLKSYCPISNQHLQIYLITKKTPAKQKCVNLGPKIPYLGIFGLEFKKTTGNF